MKIINILFENYYYAIQLVSYYIIDLLRFGNRDFYEYR